LKLPYNIFESVAFESVAEEYYTQFYRDFQLMYDSYINNKPEYNPFPRFYTNEFKKTSQWDKFLMALHIAEYEYKLSIIEKAINL